MATIISKAWVRGGTGDDVLDGTSWNDTIHGGNGGADYLQGGAGSDTYVWKQGDGNDNIDDQSGSTTEVDVLKLEGLNASDVTLSRLGQHLYVTDNATGEKISVSYQYYSSTANWGVEQIQFADGTSWDLSTINGKAWIRGGTGNESLFGSAQNDTLQGNGGADYLQGGAGSDTYVWKQGDGNDNIDDQSGSTTEVDVLKLEGLNASDVTLSRLGQHLYVTDNATGEKISVSYQYYSSTANWGVEQIQFADGTSWDHSTINGKAWIRGGTGNESLFGSAQNDTLQGNGGADYLQGGAGSDTYVWKQGDGNDNIDDQSGSTSEVDVLKLEDLNASDVTLSRLGAHLYLTANATGEKITIDYQYYSPVDHWGVGRFSSPTERAGIFRRSTARRGFAAGLAMSHCSDRPRTTRSRAMAERTICRAAPVLTPMCGSRATAMTRSTINRVRRPK